MAEPAHLRMARTGGAQGLGFDFGEMPEPPPPAAQPRLVPGVSAAEAVAPQPQKEVWIDQDDVKYETVKDDSKDQPGVIRAATLERLVERLTHEKISDPKFRKAFLLTYRSFTTPLQLIESLLFRFEPYSMTTTDDLKSKRARVIGVVKAWMEEHFYDFGEPEVQDALINFFKEVVLTMSSAGALHKKFEKKIQETEKQKAVQQVLYVKPSLEHSYFKTLGEKGWHGIDVKVFAEQMTLLESKIYCAILPKECMSWNKKDKETLAPNISAMIKQFNLFSNWVSCALVTQATLEGRVSTLKKFIDLMEALQALNNFNGMMEVLSGVNSSSVRRMKKTFSSLDAEYTKKFDKIEFLLSHKLSYKEYRHHLHNINPPCVPYMGVYLTDLTFLMDGNPDNVDGGLINFKKRRLIAEVIEEIHQYQVGYLKNESVACIQTWMAQLPNMDDDSMYRWSKRVEPKDNEVVIEELIKSEKALNSEIEEYEKKVKEMEELVKAEREKRGAK
uniref:Ras-GEF domain-containing protein n=1 Tax=Paramoeba aestuarina TaxID=180227 RepID=A0A7S4PFG4_9EUKA|eukprot:CAMPEP_0201523528 /NCGR_PEP_ID=MMETSP0161_2-20130828/20196_1 /ASSEMBLY_ACC=CAM_ASM_000251 /TAXON_ID=180227 /ORGANISM="Neoparamoeba aestuarina, Strain SoJaBio B1-5/56/2" /LENGTH=501 /DNA_ID=CAMNT_0047922679 /DNA_START=35 /DNA_END=1540 /DNA_ORIENTATION=+